MYRFGDEFRIDDLGEDWDDFWLNYPGHSDGGMHVFELDGACGNGCSVMIDVIDATEAETWAWSWEVRVYEESDGGSVLIDSFSSFDRADDMSGGGYDSWDGRFNRAVDAFDSCLYMMWRSGLVVDGMPESDGGDYWSFVGGMGGRIADRIAGIRDRLLDRVIAIAASCRQFAEGVSGWIRVVREELVARAVLLVRDPYRLGHQVLMFALKTRLARTNIDRVVADFMGSPGGQAVYGMGCVGVVAVIAGSLAGGEVGALCSEIRDHIDEIWGYFSDGLSAVSYTLDAIEYVGYRVSVRLMGEDGVADDVEMLIADDGAYPDITAESLSDAIREGGVFACAEDGAFDDSFDFLNRLMDGLAMMCCDGAVMFSPDGSLEPL